MIIHMDLDCFFVSAERTRIKELKNKPAVVCKGMDMKIFSTKDTKSVMCGSVGAFNSLFQHHREFRGYSKDGWREDFVDKKGVIHGIVVAKSYEAKKYGIKTGTSLRDALVMCPNLCVVHEDHLFYQLLSSKLKEYLQKKIPILEQYSIDEFWGDLNGYIKDEDTQEFIRELQDDILKKFNLPISIGASHTKWIAKFATNFNKPFGITIVEKDEVEKFVKDQSVRSFPGIGRALQKKLYEYRIQTLGELLTAKSLITSWGKVGRDLYSKICGEDDERVVQSRDRRSIGISRNFEPIDDRTELKRRVFILTRHLCHTIMKLNLNPTTYYFSIKYVNDISSKSSFSVERVFNETYLKKLMIESFTRLDTHPHYKVRHLGISASNFIDKDIQTLSLFDIDEDKKGRALDSAFIKLRDKYGVDIIRSAIEKDDSINKNKA